MAEEVGEKKEAEPKRSVHTYPLIRVSVSLKTVLELWILSKIMN